MLAGGLEAGPFGALWELRAGEHSVAEPINSEVAAEARETTPAGDRPTAWQGPRSQLGLIPERIGRYGIRRIIDGGGMGTVYEAVQDHPRRTVALKVMKASLRSTSAERRFELESQVLAQLHHPGIVQVYESGIDIDPGDPSHPVPYFAMEYIAGAKPITQYARDNAFSVHQKLELFCGVCEAVAHGHQNGVIHRDLKPENILVDAAGQPRIIDFGVARAIGAATTASTQQTDVGQLLGTIPYMAPEQIDANPSEVDSRSDVYALGVILYELLCERMPYTASKSDLLAAAKAIKQDPPAKPSTTHRRLRGDLETILLKALEKDRKRRYQSAEELRIDIQRYLHDEPLITARPPTVGYIIGSKTRSILRRQPAAMVLLAVVLLAGLLTEVVGVQAVYRWTPANDWFYGWATTNFGPDRYLAAFEHVRVIHLNDETVDRMPELAERLELEKLDPDVVPSWRVLHGRLMERLQSAGAKALAFDIEFPSTQAEYDEDFARGVRALEAVDVPVIVTAAWDTDELGRPFVSESFIDLVRCGGYTIGTPQIGIWQVDLLVQRSWNEVRPSLALATVAASMNPRFEPSFAFEEGLLQVGAVQYTDAANPGFWIRPEGVEKRPLRLSAKGFVEEPLSAVEADTGMLPEDLVGLYFIEPPSPEATFASTIAYHDVFDMTGDELRERFGGKILVVGDARSDAPDWLRYGDTRVHGSVGHATAIDLLLRGEPILLERLGLARLAVTFAAVLGIIVAMVGAGHALRRYTILAIAAVAMLVSSVVAYTEFRYLTNPIVPIIALVLASELTVLVNRIRNVRAA